MVLFSVLVVIHLQNTFVLRHVVAPKKTPNGQHQRHPEDLQDLMKYEVVDFENARAAGPLKVILLQDVEDFTRGSLRCLKGIGHQFDVVEVNRRLARTDLLLTKKAIYASPFDLEYYGKLKEKMKDELAKRIRIPYEYVLIGRELMKMVVPVKVSADNPWKLDRTIIKCALRFAGIEILDDMVFLKSDAVSGPNFDLEGSLVRFYVVVCNQYIVPMIGRITHVSADDSRQVLSPEQSSETPTKNEMMASGIHSEEPYFSTTPDINLGTNVIEIMRKKKK